MDGSLELVDSATGQVLKKGNPDEILEAAGDLEKGARDSGRIYKPSPKHDTKSGLGSPNPIPNDKIG